MALQKTARDACSRKVHCVKKGYLEDPFVSFFASDGTIVNSPMMNRGTWLRTVAIENAIIEFAARFSGTPIQVISFGAGDDALYFRLKQSHPEVALARFVELDLPDLVLEKHAVISKRKELSSLVTSDYRLLAVDLRNIDDLMQILRINSVQNVPTILLAEMVFVYMEESITSRLLSTVNHYLAGDSGNPPPTLLVTYDAMCPDDRFGQMMCETLRSFGVELKGIHSLPTPEAHAERCKRVGFKAVNALSMRALYLTVPQETQRMLQQKEMIDDWDEWNLMHDHYCFLVASTDEWLPSIF